MKFLKFFRNLLNSILDTVFGKSDMELKMRTLSEPEFLMLMRPLKHNDGVVCLFRIENTLIREMIFALKYRKNVRVATLFGSALGSYLTSRDLSDHILIPIPLSKKRRAARGFNQMELVLSHCGSWKSELNTLLKVKETKPQTALQRTERLANLEGAFAVSKSSHVKNKKVALIDDVTTTGATLKEAARTLKAAGAKSVVCIALAR